MSIRRLRRLTAEIDEQHQESMRTIDDELGELHFGADPVRSASRRRFLTRAAAGGAIAFGASAIPVGSLVPSALAQTSGSTPGSTPGAAPAASTAKVQEAADLAIVVFLQTVELAAVQLYGAMVDSGRLSSPVAESARQFALHHQDHATKLAEYAGNQALNTPNATLVAQFGPRLTNAGADATKAEQQLAQVAFDLETGIAATHDFAIGEFDGWEIAGVASTILPIEAQHALAWSLVIETDITKWSGDLKTWLPAFQTDGDAFRPSQYAAS